MKQIIKIDRFVTKWFSTILYGLEWHFSLLVAGVPYHDPFLFFYATCY